MHTCLVVSLEMSLLEQGSGEGVLFLASATPSASSTGGSSITEECSMLCISALHKKLSLLLFNKSCKRILIRDRAQGVT